ncbi:MAG: 3-phosphoglycerate dehydrogenase [Clostridia bacterium]|nr:3-phosphoglycerate dehydrogenase [Clostridia bacterium]
MKNIQLLNKIAKVGLAKLPADYVVADTMDAPDGMMVRSAVMHDMVLPDSLLAIARAGAGVNNIPLDKCAEAGIVVFNTPGANANGVKELTVCALLLAARDIVGGINWAQSLDPATDVAKAVEKGKSAFAGTELRGKTLGVVGLGAIGGMVANTALALGMNVIGCDPFLSVDAAWHLDPRIVKAATFDELFAKADYLTLHVPATKDTKGMVNAASLATMKDGAKIINLARADLVLAADVIAALESGKLSAYVTDFPTPEFIGVKGAVTIPHLGASTEESEDNCAIMAAEQLADYLENGNIVNSVNFPALSMPRSGESRVCVLHKNIPNVIATLSAAISAKGHNIENMASKSKGDYAYTIFDISGTMCACEMDDMDGVLRVRCI